MADFMDLFFVGGIVGFFLLVLAFAHVCHVLGETK